MGIFNTKKGNSNVNMPDKKWFEILLFTFCLAEITSQQGANNASETLLVLNHGDDEKKEQPNGKKWKSWV